MYLLGVYYYYFFSFYNLSNKILSFLHFISFCILYMGFFTLFSLFIFIFIIFIHYYIFHLCFYILCVLVQLALFLSLSIVQIYSNIFISYGCVWNLNCFFCSFGIWCMNLLLCSPSLCLYISRFERKARSLSLAVDRTKRVDGSEIGDM